MEFLRGTRFDFDKNGNQVPVYKKGDSIGFARQGIFGHCEFQTPALFMQNTPEETCVIAYKPIKQETCREMDFKNIANLKLQKGDGLATEITARPG